MVSIGYLSTMCEIAGFSPTMTKDLFVKSVNSPSRLPTPEVVIRTLCEGATLFVNTSGTFGYPHSRYHWSILPSSFILSLHVFINIFKFQDKSYLKYFFTDLSRRIYRSKKNKRRTRTIRWIYSIIRDLNMFKFWRLILGALYE